jgi:hypothetical protein
LCFTFGFFLLVYFFGAPQFGGAPTRLQEGDWVPK